MQRVRPRDARGEKEAVTDENREERRGPDSDGLAIGEFGGTHHIGKERLLHPDKTVKIQRYSTSRICTWPAVLCPCGWSTGVGVRSEGSVCTSLSEGAHSLMTSHLQPPTPVKSNGPRGSGVYQIC